MTIQTIDPQDFKQKTRRIRSQVSTILMKWGLLPRFKRWRLTQDPNSGMVVLFGILNHKYIASRTPIPFSDYFDPRLLHELANELQVQIVSCNNDGLRYAFILDRGQIDKLQQTHIDFPFIDMGRLLVRDVYNGTSQSRSTPAIDPALLDDRSFVRQMVAAVSKVFDDIKLKDDAILQLAAQNRPAIVIVDQDEFNKRMEKHEANRQRIKRIGELLDKAESQSLQP